MRVIPRSTPRPAGLALAWGLVALACGPAVSLDDPAPGSAGPMTGSVTFGPTSGADGSDAESAGLDDGERLDLGSLKLDVAPDVPLPPGVCPPDCQFELNLAWSYQGLADDPPTPLDPEDQVFVLVEPDDRVMVAEERQGAITLARLDASGQELWTMPLDLPCDPCRLVDLRLHPSGDLLLAARGVDGAASPAAVAARIELDAPELLWASSNALTIGPSIAPRAGPLVAHDDSLLLQPVIEGSMADGLERLELLAYDALGGGLLSVSPIVASTATGDAPVPRAAHDARGLLVLAQPVWAGGGGLAGEVRWVSALDGRTLQTGPRLEPILRLAAAPGGRMLTLGQTLGANQSALRLGSGHLDDPEQWTLTYVVDTITTSLPDLAVDSYGDAHVVIRTAQGIPGRETDVELLVLRWSDQGTLVWKLALPLPFDRVDEPISLQLTAEEDLVLGGFVVGARHVERRVPNCNCG